MVVWKRGTDWEIDLKAALWSEKFDSGRLERVVTWEQKCTPVKAALIWTLLKAKDKEMPGIYVAFLGRGDEIC